MLKLVFILFLGIFTALITLADKDDTQNHRIVIRTLNSPVKQKFAEFSLELPAGFLPGRAEYEIESIKSNDSGKSEKLKIKDKKVTLINQGRQSWLAKIPVDALEPGNFKIEFEVKAAKSWMQGLKDFTKKAVKGADKDKHEVHPNRGEYKGRTLFVVINTLEVPDPGEAGLATLAGIDSDNDGVRDDVQRWILENHGDSEKTVAALKQVARTQQAGLLIAFVDRAKSIEASFLTLRALHCLGYLKGLDQRIELRKQLDSQILNTDSRIRAEIRTNANFNGQVIEGREVQKSDCDFDPNVMPN